MKKFGYLGAGLLLGAVAGMLGTIAHSGPVDLPVVGSIIAMLLVAAGAWLALEVGGAFGWTGYALGALGVTIWLLFWPPHNDVLVSTTGWVSEIWGVLVVVAAWVPLLIQGRRRRRGNTGNSEESVR